MNRLLAILGLVLLAQIVLAAGLSMGASSTGELAPGEPLLHFDPAAVDRIVIATPGKDPLVLAKHGKAWRLPKYFGVPAASGKVEAFAGRLAGLKPRLPVATTSDAATRFKVGADHYARKVTLHAGDRTVATLYLGKADGARRTYARARGSNAVYDVDLGAYQAGTKPTDWSDPNLLHLKEADITRVQLHGITLQRHKHQWRVDGLGKGKVTDQDQVTNLLDQLANLSYLAVLGTKDQPAFHQGKPALKFTVDTKSGKNLSYVFSKPAKGDDYVLKTSARDFYFKVPKYAVKDLLNASRDKLARAKAGSKSSHHASASDTGGTS
jgi:hypothetical protein